MNGGATRWRSIDRKLPLAISALLLVTVVTFSFAAYQRVKRVVLGEAAERLLSSAQPLAVMLQQSADRGKVQLGKLATNPVMREFLVSRADSSTALQLLASAGGLVDSARRRVVLLDSTGAPALTFSHGAVMENSDWIARTIVQHRPNPGEVIIGPLFARGDTVFGQVLAAMPAVPSIESNATRESGRGGRASGFVADMRAISGRGVAPISQILGDKAVLLVGSSDGVWTDLSKPLPPPPAGIQAGHTLQFDESPRGAGVGAAIGIQGTPWVLWVEQPRGAVITPARRVLVQLAMLAVVFIIAGIVAGSMISRRITRPIIRMRESVERVAAGTASASTPNAPRLAVTEGDEIAHLTDAFERMSARVSESHDELERRVAERTTRLEGALAELERTQSQLVQKERLAMLGQLASSVGHELRNPLGVMTNAIYVIEHTLTDAPAPVKDYLELVRGQIAVSERIVGDLLDTARIRPPQTEAVSLPDLVDVQLHRHGPLNGVTVRRDFPSDLPPAAVDPAQLAQILLNLISNAAHAMSDTPDGVLTIGARAATGGRVELEVRDTGPGIPADLQDRIFEPLFTTKARGLGLGLWVSRSLAQVNRAELRLAQTPSGGASFIVDMPAAGNGAGHHA